MTVEIASIKAGLAANLQTLNDSMQVSAYRLKQPNPPALLVLGPGEIVRTGFGFGSFEIQFIVQGIAGAPTEESAQIRLDQWLSPLGAVSVWAAIESDKTLGGVVGNTIVTKCDGEQWLETKPGVESLGSTWHVQIEL